MSSTQTRPYREPSETSQTVDRLHKGATPIVHTQQIIQDLRNEKALVPRFNGWLADHIVGLAGTMGFFYCLALLMACWAFWQVVVLDNRGFDPFPFAFLFFILGGIMQSLFVPTMLTASNRAALRDRIKDEADHRAWSHLYDVNDEQLKLLRQLADQLLAERLATPADDGSPA